MKSLLGFAPRRCPWPFRSLLNGLFHASLSRFGGAFVGYNARLQEDEEWKAHLRDAHVAHRALRQQLLSERPEDWGGPGWIGSERQTRVFWSIHPKNIEQSWR